MTPLQRKIPQIGSNVQSSVTQAASDGGVHSQVDRTRQTGKLRRGIDDAGQRERSKEGKTKIEKGTGMVRD